MYQRVVAAALVVAALLGGPSRAQLMTTGYLLVSQSYQGPCTSMGARSAVYGCRLTCVRLSADFMPRLESERRRRSPRKWHHGATAARAWAKPTGTEGGPWVIRRRKGILA